MEKEKFFCLVDVKFYEEDTYIPRHNKIILQVADFDEALQYVHEYIGENIEDIHMCWAGKKDKGCKQELIFTESEFAAFDMVKNIIEDDHSYEDYCQKEKEYEESRENR